MGLIRAGRESAAGAQASLATFDLAGALGQATNLIRQVDIFITVYGKSYQQLADSGKIKILAMLNKERLESVKQYPAITETKQLKNFDFNIWTGYFVKKDTPEAVVQALHKAITETLNDTGVRSGLETNSLLVAKPLPLTELNKVYAEGTAQFRAIAKSINLQPQ